MPKMCIYLDFFIIITLIYFNLSLQRTEDLLNKKYCIYFFINFKIKSLFVYSNIANSAMMLLSNPTLSWDMNKIFMKIDWKYILYWKIKIELEFIYTLSFLFIIKTENFNNVAKFQGINHSRCKLQ